ncbi:MAG TPA: hypothetical protein VFJ13_08665 [Paracoccaceae bacterium]|nr:hypothetical protein [Paracoccaceae bacterium]
MSQLEHALRRLDGAMARLESAIAAGVLDGAVAGAAPEVAELQAERDRLSDEVWRLRARADEDARLRAEAAAAVRDALHDLRGAIGQEPQGMHGNA